MLFMDVEVELFVLIVIYVVVVFEYGCVVMCGVLV